MEQVAFGSTGIRISRLCLGTATFGLQADEATSFAIMDCAAQSGINFLDTSDIYPQPCTLDVVGRSETLVGKWLKGRREDFFLATKCGGPMGPASWQRGASRKHILSAIEGSLRRLQTDYVDLYQIHYDDPETPLDETLGALDALVRSGRARYTGCSNFLAARFARALGRSEARGFARFVSVQPRYNLLFREYERELLPLCRQEGIAVIAFGPLAGGLLTGKHRRDRPPEGGTRFSLGTAKSYMPRYWHDREFDAVEAIEGLARDLGCAIATLSLAWVLANPAVTAPIIGASRPDQLRTSFAALDFRLDPALKEKLDEITHTFRMGDARS